MVALDVHKLLFQFQQLVQGGPQLLGLLHLDPCYQHDDFLLQELVSYSAFLSCPQNLVELVFVKTIKLQLGQSTQLENLFHGRIRASLPILL